MKDEILGGVVGLCVADALGLPVQFIPRHKLHKNPVTEMTGYGYANLPPGSWSDDSSMTLCLLDSLTASLDYNDIMNRFQRWLKNGDYTPYGKAFDVGKTTLFAIAKYIKGCDIWQCGGTDENSNGNGSLMRILPIVFYLSAKGYYSASFNDEAFNIIHNVSALTHAHARSKIACGIYCSIASNLIDDYSIVTGVREGLERAREYYEGKAEFKDERKHYIRLFDDEFCKLPEEKIKSSGYVVDTLEAAVWCLLNTQSYEDCVLKAVNLGHDTDTVAAVAGGLAGIYYGLEAIPSRWLGMVARFDYIKELCDAFADSLFRLSGSE